MPETQARKPLPNLTCNNCDLRTPAWRGYCIHCGQALKERSSSEASASDQRSSAQRNDRVAGAAA